MNQISFSTEIIIHKNEDLVRFLNNLGDAEYLIRSKGAELVFSCVDAFLEKEDFAGLRDLLDIATTQGLPLAYNVCLLMSTNEIREKCQPARDALISNLLKKYDGHLIEGTTIQQFLIGLV